MLYLRVSLSLSLSLSCVALAACSNHSVAPLTPAVQTAFAAAKKTFGVGYATQALLLYNAAPHEHDYCQTKGHGFDDCPSYADGKKSESHSASGSGKDSTSGAKVAYDQSGTSLLGREQYSQKVSAASKHVSFASASGQEHFGWTDVLRVKSGSHAKLTPVTIWFELTVNPSKTSVNCKYDPTADLEFTATGSDKQQSNLDVTGKCINGKFTYTLDNGNGGKGLKDVGYTNTSVGSTVAISGTGTIREAACQLAASCPKSYASDLVGSVTWRIKKITPGGVSVTSDSGTGYSK